MSGRTICLPKARRAVIGDRPLAGRFDAQSRTTGRGRQNHGRLSGHWAGFRDQQQGESRPCGWPRGSAPGAGVNAQATGRDWRNHPGELPVGHRGGGGFGGGDIRLDTGAPQISRGIFPHIRVKSPLSLAGEGATPSGQPALTPAATQPYLQEGCEYRDHATYNLQPPPTGTSIAIRIKNWSKVWA